MEEKVLFPSRWQGIIIGTPLLLLGLGWLITAWTQGGFSVDWVRTGWPIAAIITVVGLVALVLLQPEFTNLELKESGFTAR